eukprot:Mycagemm_TRINITY_DN10390_c6_g9::TRINITY_DN10390_c6_g9_i1::g.812::m.812 type:complete len:106 gc:universal TRINITY_DN10390_c6_g9_i1:135-452(+)
MMVAPTATLLLLALIVILFALPSPWARRRLLAASVSSLSFALLTTTTLCPLVTLSRLTRTSTSPASAPTRISALPCARPSRSLSRTGTTLARTSGSSQSCDSKML